MIASVRWHPSIAELRKFGLVLIVGFGILGGLFLWRGKPHVAHWLWIVGGGVGVWALLLPRWSVWFYRVWMSLGVVIGAISSRIVMTAVFFVIITPVALFFRLKGRDALTLKKPSNPESYWIKHPEQFDESYYKHLF
jgi:hypothetical protein